HSTPWFREATYGQRSLHLGRLSLRISGLADREARSRLRRCEPIPCRGGRHENLELGPLDEVALRGLKLLKRPTLDRGANRAHGVGVERTASRPTSSSTTPRLGSAHDQKAERIVRSLEVDG